jgi:phosphoglucomutase
MDYQERNRIWLESLPEGDPLHEELLTLQGNEKELQERFVADMVFGTAGLRGKIGAGTMRMNYYTVGRATEGIAQFILEKAPGEKDKGVIIAHDPRHFSHEFSELTAVILAEHGIPAFVFPDLRPTPELAFLIRKIGTVSGINITASHNPKDYNGYKVYWTDGCQVSAEIADGMTEKIAAAHYFSDEEAGSRTAALSPEARKARFEALKEEGLIRVLGVEYDRMYLDEVESLAIHEGDELDLDVPFIYTPLNGAGSIPFREMLTDRGFRNWQIVPEQEMPDPDFTTVGYPNPEDPKAFRLAEELGRKTGAELLMATDPDSDRFAIEILSEDGNYVPLNGNQTGYLLVNYILEGRKDAGTLPERGAMVESIVTSPMSAIMAEAYGVKMFEALTGFKNLCGRIPELTERGYTCLFAYEESVGYAASTNIRDKDGISAGMLVAEAAAYYRTKGQTLWQVLMGLYEKYGYFAEDEPNLVLEGLSGAARIRRMMEAIRKEPFTEVAGAKVVSITDYLHGHEDIPASNVLRFELDNHTRFSVRPSGTEPKIKFYFYTCQDSREHALAVNQAVKEAVLSKIQEIE